MSNLLFSVKLQPIDLSLATLLEKKWQRYLAGDFSNFFKELNQSGKTYVAKSVFDNVARIDSIISYSSILSYAKVAFVILKEN